MKHIQLLYVDLFCGAGGTSTGVEQATLNGEKCAHVVACVNHDPTAIESHAANHPDAHHFTEDIRTLAMEPLVATVEEARREFPKAKLVLWASLECTNFSRAKGGKPRDADSRTLAEHLFRYYFATIAPMMHGYRDNQKYLNMKLNRRLLFTTKRNNHGVFSCR